MTTKQYLTARRRLVEALAADLREAARKWPTSGEDTDNEMDLHDRFRRFDVDMGDLERRLSG